MSQRQSSIFHAECKECDWYAYSYDPDVAEAQAEDHEEIPGHQVEVIEEPMDDVPSYLDTIDEAEGLV